MRDRGLHSWRVIAGLTVGVAVLMASFNTVPFAVLSHRFGAYQPLGALEDAVARGLAELWRSGRPQLPALLVELAAYCSAWHAIKTAICVLLVVALVLLAAGLWQRYLFTVTPRAAGHRLAATVATVLAPLAIVVLIANIQATVVPLVALLQVLPEPGSMPAARTSADIVAALTDPAHLDANAPVISLLVAQVERYHWVLAASCAPLVIGLSLLSVIWWRRARAGSGRVRSMATTLGIVTILSALTLLGVTVIAVSAALDPFGAVIDVLGGAGPR